MAAEGSLNVIALVSGGKDSFYSLLHCLANGHRVVALANLHPAAADDASANSASTSGRSPSPSPRHHRPGETTRHQHGARAALDGDGDDGRQEVDVVEEEEQEHEETDLNSLMYQTVGHQVIPLYAQATGLPLFRQPIVGTSVHHGVSYQHDSKHHQNQKKPRPSTGPDSATPLLLSSAPEGQGTTHGTEGGHDHDHAHNHEHRDEHRAEDEVEEDETESLVPLLRAVLKAHPEANALCTGAILSTYQRTRVESVALRLGLVPLAYLWQFPELPTAAAAASLSSLSSLSLSSGPAAHDLGCSSGGGSAGQAGSGTGGGGGGDGAGDGNDDAQLLRDMAAVGLDARIIKVASAGLDEDFLWANVASVAGAGRVQRAMRRFGGAGSRGAVIGEGGEFETLVVDGPRSLFKGRIVVPDAARRVVREGGGCAWLSIGEASVEMKRDVVDGDGADIGADRDPSTPQGAGVRIPALLDPKFEDILQSLCHEDQHIDLVNLPRDSPQPELPRWRLPRHPEEGEEWCFYGGRGHLTVEDQTAEIVDQIRGRLQERSLPANAITNTVIALRRMSDFPVINQLYGSLFREPNPPSRVTISCCDGLLPQAATIAIFLSIQPRLRPDDRRGLHVQSRSYWAPANIGPYSQAVAFPLLPPSSAGDDQNSPQQHSPLAVCIAGQIPLLPASMVLPSSSTPDDFRLQTTLALQHLWRVAVEMHVQWWTSAVAYLPRAPSAEAARHRAQLAAASWRAAHLWSQTSGSSGDEEEAGPDLWDRRYNTEFMTYGDGEAGSVPLLPDWEVLAGFDFDDDDDDDEVDGSGLKGAKEANLPFMFTAEVEELPRQAGVEWHAHVGLARLEAGSVRLFSVRDVSVPLQWGAPDDTLLDIHHVIVECGDGVYIQSTTVLQKSQAVDSVVVDLGIIEFVTNAVGTSLNKVFVSEVFKLSSEEKGLLRRKITYINASQGVDFGVLSGIGALVPCRSLWDSWGRRLGLVAIYETRLVKS
ncbi:Uu.00g039250.m01.CDS01 [Anthostomella pinea]|uniref:Diphthine--ammonia ligase n=1 Tax=Anthostomella pinea TaxID=933095 RepID=A0AAI8VAM2_9PEZI|nr:Uu.00g039250.m01.CDS01 [Anthostomella pinea]